MDTTANTTPQMSTRETATISETAETVDDAGIETAQQEATSVVSTSDGTVESTQNAEEGGDNTKDKWVITWDWSVFLDSFSVPASDVNSF